jgi:uncharacterized protein YbbC (DUF1343 family)/CubicO group peptidase (beta-lactamase class C family)
MCRSLLLLALLLLALPAASLTPRAARAGDDRSPWQQIDALATKAVEDGDTPGVVFLVGRGHKVLYRKAFGYRSLQPERTPMSPDTLFDLASLTKVVATTSAVMDLVQQGKLRLRDPASRYWPEFAQSGKERITIRQLMTHTSGLPAWENYYTKLGDPAKPGVQDRTGDVLAGIAATKLAHPPGTRFVYSDLGFITLGEIVRRVSGERLDEYTRRRIFEPLGMKETTFNPDARLSERAAPTEKRAGRWMQGEVHDPNAAVTAGVAGHAGLFSTADDLARFARMLVSSDEETDRSYPLGPYTVREMTTPHTPAGLPVRGLGWDIDSPYSHVRGDLFPLGSFGHTGFTGTFLWIDPFSKTYVIGLSNRVHPDGKGNILPLWAKVSNVVASLSRPAKPLPRAELAESAAWSRQPLKVGIDVLQAEGFKALQGRRVGLITNRTGVNRQRVSTIDLLHQAPGVQLVALFAPEHGLRADRDEFIEGSSSDEKTGLPIHSLYGRGAYKPTAEQLKGLDTLVYDIQDIGVRYYTYITTLGLCMEAAAENKLRFVVLDRPNPVNGLTVDGPYLDPALRTFAGWYRIPVRHGLTVGEMARLYNQEFGIKCDLQVVTMEGWRRSMWFDQTGVPWVDPSPNIRNTREAELYPGIGLLERANVSVGRGTDTPFERFGAPWIDGNRLAQELNRRRLPGLAFTPVSFRPNASVFQGQLCGGCDVRMLDRDAFDGCRSAVEILDALVSLFPNDAKIDRTHHMWGTADVPRAILAGKPVGQIVASYQPAIREFQRQRQPYLLYR